jgi:hypothetical protein
MFRKDKKAKLFDTLLPPKKQSHKKRNTLIGLGAVAALAVAGATATKGDSQ